MLPEREGALFAPVLRPGVPVLRGKDHPDDRHSPDCCIGVCNAAPSPACRVGELRTQRDGNQAIGQRPDLHWPGKGAGIRGPIGDETPLSAQEVEYA